MLGNWEKILTKTPILVLFIILISVGVGTASALITITLAGDVVITDSLTVDTDTLVVDSASDRVGIGVANPTKTLDVAGDVLVRGSLWVGTDDATGDDFICMDDSDCSEKIIWDDSDSQFQFTDDIVTVGVIQAGNNGPNVSYNRLGSGTSDSGFVTNLSDLFVSGDIESDGNIVAGSGDLFVGIDNPLDDDSIFFDSGTTENLTWRNSQTRFLISDELAVDGPIITGAVNTQFPYNSMGVATASAAAINGVADLSISDALEVGSDIYLGRAEGDSDIRFFNNGVSNGERFQWDDSADAFEVSDDFTVFGKLTVTGLIDPPAVTFSAETHDSTKQLAIGVSDHEEVMLFWNGDNNRFEVYVILQDAFYTLDEKEVKYLSTGIPENSAVNRLAEFEEQEKARLANPEVEESDPEIEE